MGKEKTMNKSVPQNLGENRSTALVSKEEPCWDPMKEEFQSGQNQVGPKYGFMRNEEYETSDGKRICKFYRSKGLCHRGQNCEYLHIFTGSDFHKEQGELMIVPERLEELPCVNHFAIVQLGYIEHQGNFFANMPFGNLDLRSYKDVSHLNDCVQSIIESRKDKVMELQIQMTRYYGNRGNNNNNEQAFSPGEIVATRTDNEQWRRARIIHTEVHPDPFSPQISVQFVDYGNINNVLVTDVRKIKREFLNLKFQAFECKLEGLVPTSGLFWPQKSVESFREIIGEGLFIAHVIKRYTNGALGLDIYKTGHKKSISDILVQKGIAKYEGHIKVEEVYRFPG